MVNKMNMKGKYLITTDAWFYAPNGKLYRAVWGEVNVIGDEMLGIKTNRNSTNWFVKVGSDNNHIIIAGCQIHYAVRCENEPDTSNISDYNLTDGEYKQSERPTQIWIAI